MFTDMVISVADNLLTINNLRKPRAAKGEHEVSAYS